MSIWYIAGICSWQWDDCDELLWDREEVARLMYKSDSVMKRSAFITVGHPMGSWHWFSFQWGWVISAYSLCPIRTFVDCCQFPHRSQFPSTTLVQKCHANVGSSTSTITRLRWYVWGDSSVQPDHACNLPSQYSLEMNAFKPGRMEKIALVSLIVFVSFYLFSLTLVVMRNFLVCGLF